MWFLIHQLGRYIFDCDSTLLTTGSELNKSLFSYQGEKVFQRLKEAGLERGIRIRVAQNQPSQSAPDQDTLELEKLDVAEVRNLDFSRLVGAGILHTKLWVVDKKHFFVGSANMDWRSLTQVTINTITKVSPNILQISLFYFLGERAGSKRF